MEGQLLPVSCVALGKGLPLWDALMLPVRLERTSPSTVQPVSCWESLVRG